MPVATSRARSHQGQLGLFAPGEVAVGPPPLRCCVLGSGSSGNAVVVECGRRRILLDAGFSAREIVARARRAGIDPGTLEAVVLTHEHQDHIRGVDRLARRFSLPIFATEGTLAGTPLSAKTLALARRIRSGERAMVGGFEVEPFAIPHDAREPVGLVVTDPHGRRLGLASDLGMRSRLAWGRLRDLDALILETNHDLEMLRSGPYPWPLKQRVAGSHGHLSNADAADGLDELVGDRLRSVVLYHLSRTNNLPALALAAVGERLDRLGARAQPVLTSQREPSPWIEIQTSLPLGGS
jgi:phosphoribosyl 1,2-cyclic phosphodiesterase